MGKRGGAGGGEGWKAGGWLNPPLGLFGLAMSPKVPAIGPNMLRWPKTRLPVTGANFKPIYIFYVAPSMGPIVSVMNLQGQQNSL